MKRLYKSRKNRMIAGVCGGIAEYFNVDPVLIRLIAVLFFFTGGAALIAYIIGLIIMPDQPQEGTPEGEADHRAAAEAMPQRTPAESIGQSGSMIIGIILMVFGVHFLLRNIPFFHNFYWRFWNMGWQFFWPAVLIVVGLVVILRGVRK